MVESGIAERIAARRAELDELEDQLAKQLEEVRAEHDALAVTEHVKAIMTGVDAMAPAHDDALGLQAQQAPSTDVLVTESPC